MTNTLRYMGLAAACVLWAAGAGAQTANTQSSAPAQPSTSSTSSSETRPATTTFFGDTGLWFVPTAEVLPHGKFSASVYRRGTNWIQGYTNVADFAGTFGVGIKNRAEIFESFLVDTRIDRDVRPIFVNDPSFGSFIDRYPLVNRYWTGDHVGDLYVGGKVNLISEGEGDPAAFAFRGLVKLPTGDKDIGNSTGKADFAIDAVLSKDAGKVVEVAGYAGFEGRGKPDNFDIPTTAFRWGAGAGFPSHNFLRISAEINGYAGVNDGATTTTPIRSAVDNSFSLLRADTE